MSRGQVTEAASPWANNNGVVTQCLQYHPFGCEYVMDVESLEIISDNSFAQVWDIAYTLSSSTTKMKRRLRACHLIESYQAYGMLTISPWFHHDIVAKDKYVPGLK